MTEDSPSGDGVPDATPTGGDETEREDGETTEREDGETTERGDGDTTGPSPGDGAVGGGDDATTETSTTGPSEDQSSPTVDGDPDTAAVASSRQPSEDSGDTGTAGAGPSGTPEHERGAAAADVPEDVAKYQKFTKIDGGTYDRANDFLRERTYITAREWAIARLCADFRTETGVEMTKIGEHLPELVPFMTDTYTPQAVNQARAAFEEKVRKSGATFLYGAMSDFFTAEELDDVMYEATEVAKFLLEVEGVDLTVEEELEAEDRISEVMREVREHSAALRHDEVVCPECGHHIEAQGD